ncbi:MAG: prolipoprotein diacylglyceryl transferase [Bryobacteraceae bacterium]|nr:prolipoprotein diacylglyceryl transferase [Bryobacteraceae bacterium]
MLYLGIVAGILSGTVWAGSRGLDPARVNAAMLLLALPAMLGARLLFVGLHWSVYRRQPGRILRKSDAGAALFGGLAGALLTSLPLAKAFHLPLGAFWDAAAVCLLVGMIFTKIGCLLNGCCAGRSRFPLQLLEAGLAASILCGALAVSDRLPFDGALFLAALAAYGAGRFILESRRETIARIGTVSLNRAVSAGCATLSAAALLFVWLGGWP